MGNSRVRMMTVEKKPETGPFGTRKFYQYPLIYENGGFRLQTEWDEACSYGKKYGRTEGSTFFCQYDVKDVVIGNYRIATSDDFSVLKFMFNNGVNAYSNNRVGSTYNGTPGALFSFVRIYRMNGIGGIYGYIFFPDGCVINGVTLSYMNPNYSGADIGQTSPSINYNIVTRDQLIELLAQGVLFMPFLGSYGYGYGTSQGWQNIDVSGHFIAGDSTSGAGTKYAYWVNGVNDGRVIVGAGGGTGESATPVPYYFPAILCRDI